MKPSLFNESINEIKSIILEDTKDLNLCNGNNCIGFERGFNRYFKSAKCFAKWDHFKNELLLCINLNDYEESARYHAFSNNYMVLGKLKFIGYFKGCEEEQFIINDVNIEIFDSKDIEGFEKIRLRMLFS